MNPTERLVAPVVPNSTTTNVCLSPAWNAGTHANGGYLMDVIGRAMASAACFPDPLTLAAFFLRPTEPRESLVEATVIRHGATVATVEGRLVQEDRERVRIVGNFGDLSAAVGPSSLQLTPPALPPPEACVRAPRMLSSGLDQPMLDSVDLRFSPDTTVAIGALTSDRYEVAGWFRLADGSDPDVFTLAVAVDAFLPVVYESAPRAWCPTLELTLHVRARPAPGWLRVIRRTSVILDGAFEEDAEVWDSGDQLVAQSRQLARIGAPRN